MRDEGGSRVDPGELRRHRVASPAHPLGGLVEPPVVVDGVVGRALLVRAVLVHESHDERADPRDRESPPGRPTYRDTDRVEAHRLVQRRVVDALVAVGPGGHLAVLLQRLEQPWRVAARSGGGADEHQRPEALVDRRPPRVSAGRAARLVVLEPVVDQEVEAVDHRLVAGLHPAAQQWQQVVQRVHVALAAAVQRAHGLPARVRREVEPAVLVDLRPPGHQRPRLGRAALLRTTETHVALCGRTDHVDGRGAHRCRLGGGAGQQTDGQRGAQRTDGSDQQTVGSRCGGSPRCHVWFSPRLPCSRSTWPRLTHQGNHRGGPLRGVMARLCGLVGVPSA